MKIEHIDSNTRVILQGNKAFDLFTQGKEAWNEWVDLNPDADISFKKTNFNHEITSRGKNSSGFLLNFLELLDSKKHRVSVDFSGYRFPENGSITFCDASFENIDVKLNKSFIPNGCIDFSGCNFINCTMDFKEVRTTNLIFNRAHFLDTNINLSKLHTEDIKINFDESTMIHCHLKMHESVVATGKISFTRAHFDFVNLDIYRVNIDSSIIFWESKIENSIINFTFSELKENANFSKSKITDTCIYFTATNIKSGVFSLSQSEVIKCEIFFNGVKFNGGFTFANARVDDTKISFHQGLISKELTFYCSTLTDSPVRFYQLNICTIKNDFKHSKLGTIDFIDVTWSSLINDFTYTDFNGHVSFTKIKTIEPESNFDFKFSNFNKSFNFSNTEALLRIPNFTGTKNSNHFILSGLNYKLKSVGKWWQFKKAIHPEDSEILCRLKELAEANKDHRIALQFHADEMRAKRWHQSGKLASLLDCTFDKFSNYGQSILRPTICLLVTIFFMTLYTVGYAFPFSLNGSDFKSWLTNMLSISSKTWSDGLIVSLSHVIPFVGGMQGHGKDSLLALKSIIPELFGAIALLFSLPAFAFLFLIGLGLRNRFRL